MIVVDIDGVVADSEFWLVQEIEERSGVTLSKKIPRKYNFLIDTGITSKDGLRYIDDALVKYKDDITICDDNERIMVALRMIQYKEGIVNFLTARSKGRVETATHYWLRKNFPSLNYNLYSLGENANKGKWMYNNSAKAIVDDRLKTVNTIPPQYETYLIKREWNKGRYINPNVIAVNDLLTAVKDYYNV